MKRVYCVMTKGGGSGAEGHTLKCFPHLSVGYKGS